MCWGVWWYLLVSAPVVLRWVREDRYYLSLLNFFETEKRTKTCALASHQQYMNMHLRQSPIGRPPCGHCGRESQSLPGPNPSLRKGHWTGQDAGGWKHAMNSLNLWEMRKYREVYDIFMMNPRDLHEHVSVSYQ